MSSAEAKTAECLNCSAPLTDTFCSACGQATVDVAAPTWNVVRDAFADATDLDGRVLRTFRALRRPGLLTNEWLRGRRIPYVSPIKLFLFAAAVLPSTWLFTRGIDSRFYGIPADVSAAFYIKTILRGTIAATVAITLATWAMGLARRRLIDEGIFSLHLVASVSLWTTAIIWIGTLWKLGWGFATRVPDAIPALLYLLFLPAAVIALVYGIVADRRVHGHAWWAAVIRVLILGAVAVAATTVVLQWSL